jgi:hypothetical protein
VPRSPRDQHDPGDGEQDQATERARADEERRQDGDRRDQEGPKTAIICAHVAGHDGLLSAS